MFKVTFEWLESSPNGGGERWKGCFHLFDEETSEDLNNKIDSWIKNKSSSYHKHVKAVDISRL